MQDIPPCSCFGFNSGESIGGEMRIYFNQPKVEHATFRAALKQITG